MEKDLIHPEHDPSFALEIILSLAAYILQPTCRCKHCGFSRRLGRSRCHSMARLDDIWEHGQGMGRTHSEDTRLERIGRWRRSYSRVGTKTGGLEYDLSYAIWSLQAYMTCIDSS